MIVGEAPGFQEEKLGEPFVGQSGKLLDTALMALGLRRDELYVTNVVKEVPRNSEGKIRRPFPEEIKAWYPTLRDEIISCRPRAILCLGRPATDTLMGVDSAFGDREESSLATLFSAWHPSFLLHGANGIEDAREAWLEQLRPFAEALGKYTYPS